MSKTHLIFGLRDLPRPRGDGFLYYKLYPNYHEKILVHFNLYNTKPEKLKDYFAGGIKIMLGSADFKKNGSSDMLNSYSTENMRAWSTEVLAELIAAMTKSRNQCLT